MTNLTAQQLYGQQPSVATPDAPVQADVVLNSDAELLAEIQATEQLLSQQPSDVSVPQVGDNTLPVGEEQVVTADGKILNLTLEQVHELIDYATTLENQKIEWDNEKKVYATKEQSLLNQLDKVSALLQEKDEKIISYERDPRRKVLDDDLADIAFYHDEYKKNPNDKIMANRLLNSTKTIMERVTWQPLDTYIESFYASSIGPSLSENNGWIISDIPTPSSTNPMLMDKFINHGQQR